MVPEFSKTGRQKLKCSSIFVVAIFLLLAGVTVIFNLHIVGKQTELIQQQLDQPSVAKGLVTPKLTKAQQKRSEDKKVAPSKTTNHAVPSETTKKENQPNTVARSHEKPSPPTTKTTPSTTHLIFSTSCSILQDWQSYVFFFFAMHHKQPGYVTRIVSGCSPENEATLTKQHKEQIAIMSDRFLLHFTPEFGRVEGHSYHSTKYFNKPNSVKHWLEHKLGYSFENGTMSTIHDDDVVILVDPDMLLQRAFVNDFSNYPNELWTKFAVKNADQFPLYHKVSQGKPIAQDYSFGSAWMKAVKQNITHVLPHNSPVHHVTKSEADNQYTAGPPYILTAKDMYRLSYYWVKFLPPLFTVFPHFMAEMYAYCTAAAHLKMKHQIARGFMVSNVHLDHGEGWYFMKDVKGNACDIEHFKAVPHVIHFCQRYSVGDYFLSKYMVPKDILSCDAQLYELPPVDIANYTNFSHYGDGSVEVWRESKMNLLYRNAFMVCSLMSGINEAAKFYKDHHCPNGANYNQTYNHFTKGKKPRIQQMKDLKGILEKDGVIKNF